MIKPPPPRATGAVPAPPGAPPLLDPMSERFAAVWRVLDGSILRLIWPFVLGAAVAGLSLLVARSVWAAAVIAVGVVYAIGWFGRSVARRLEEADRMSD